MVAEKQDPTLLLRELNHRVKNNLQLLLSMINLHRSYNGSSSEVILDATVHRLRAIADVHEQLYTSDRTHDVDLSSYLVSLAEGILATFSEAPILLSNETPETVLLPVTRAIPVGLIVNEVIINAVKHAFCEIKDPTIQIDCFSDNRSITVIVADNGTGLPETDGLEEVGFGTLIIKALTEQIKGTGSWNRLTNRGTIYRLEFPIHS